MRNGGSLTSQKTQGGLFTKTENLVQFSEIVTLIVTNNTLCRQNVSFLRLKYLVHLTTTEY